MKQTLTQQQFVARLDGWVGEKVSVRVVVGGDDLLAVFQGVVAERSGEKSPALHWPVLGPPAGATEQPGVYLHPGLFDGAAVHEGGFVLELRQGGATLNIRRL